jgi:Ran GTPase-activating protein (RanGAP) involved in mRNA processing and transport
VIFIFYRKKRVHFFMNIPHQREQSTPDTRSPLSVLSALFDGHDSGIQKRQETVNDIDICWFSRLLTRLSEDDEIESTERKSFREIRQLYLTSLLEGDASGHVFDKFIAYTCEVFSRENADLAFNCRPSGHVSAQCVDCMQNRLDSLVHGESLNASARGVIDHLNLRGFGGLSPSNKSKHVIEARDLESWMKHSLELGDVIEVTRQVKCAAYPGFIRNGVLDLSRRNLDDEELLRSLETLSRETYQSLTAIRLSWNSLKDSSIQTVLTRYLEAGASVRIIDIGNNSRLSSESYKFLADRLCALRLRELESLSVAGIHMAGPIVAQLLSNLNTSTTPMLEALDISNTQLGLYDDAGPESLAFTLSQIRKLTVLNISYNFLSARHLSKIGEALANMDAIQRLDISFNSAGNRAADTRIPVIATLCSVLGSVASLEELRLSSTGMNDEAAFVLADSLSVHPRLKSLDLSDNPSIGVFGVKSLLRLIFFRGTLMESMNINNSLRPKGNDLFSFADPSGSYFLHMDNMLDKAIARQCFKTWESTTQAFDDTFKSMKVDLKPFKPSKDVEDIWELPESGLLNFTAVFRKLDVNTCEMKCLNEKVISQSDWDRFVEGIYDRVRNVESKVTLIQAISNSFTLDCDLSDIVMRGDLLHHLRAQIFHKIIPHVRHPGRTLKRALPFLKTLRSPIELFATSEIPNRCIGIGHFCLNLRSSNHRILAFQFVKFNEKYFDEFKDRLFFRSIRNSTLNKSEFPIPPDWDIPTSGVWEFDFITPHRLPHPTVPRTIEQKLWMDLVDTLFALSSTASENVAWMEALRHLSSQFMLSCAQLVDLLHRFAPNKSLQLDLAVLLFRRIVDYPNLKEMLCRERMGNPATFDQAMVHSLELRVGPLALFNPLRLENTTIDCDLGSEEGRVMARVVLTLLSREKGSRLVNSRVGNSPDNAVASLPPKTWFEALPDKGFWSCTYVVDEKSTNHSLRKELAINLCAFDPRTFEHD